MSEAPNLPPLDAVLVTSSPGEMRALIMRAGRPWALHIDRPSRPNRIGDIHLARVTKAEPGQGGAYVEIGEPRGAWLDDARGVSEGEAVPVQVVREASRGKGPRVTRRMALASRHLVFTVGRPGIATSRRIADDAIRQQLQGLVMGRIQPSEGIVLRAAASEASEAMLDHDLDHLRRLWAAIGERAREARPPALIHREAPAIDRLLRDAVPPGTAPVRIDDPSVHASAGRYAASHAPALASRLVLAPGGDLFEAAGLEAEIEAALEPEVPLAGGGSLAIEATRALTAIDVDSGPVRSHGKEANLLAANLIAAAEASRQIRLRNIAGLIVLDFANVRQTSARARIVAMLRRGFADDPAATEIGAISSFCVALMSRQRLGPSLAEIACENDGRPSAETWGLAALRRALSAVTATPGRQPRLTLPPAIVAALEGPLLAALDETGERLGAPLTLLADPALRPADIRIDMV
ncbi:MAG: hypothetical protein EXQ87_13015 [Alphaproteobacteria bacterium]|nr:hypothetical protein [Alphaproteobacteria bacterium]